MSEPQSIEVSVTPSGLAVAGEVDGLTAPALEAALNDLLTTNAGPHDLDLSAVTFMDSSGLRILLEYVDRARSEGGDLVLAEPSAVVVRLLELSQLQDHFTLRPAAG